MDVIVPVHGNHADAARCLASVASARTDRRFTLVVVDDASPDTGPLPIPEPGGGLAAVRVLRNDAALGFAGAVNRALAEGSGDVVLLNSDTLVFDFWLDRLCAAAEREPRAGTVTPLSNAATILSYPVPHRDFAGELEIGWEALDRLCSALSWPAQEIPTGVGFCLFLRRACIDAVGVFDVEQFGAGYGEETDLCRRAAAAGWRHIAALDTFVWHRGSGSFGERAASLKIEAARRMRKRHPGYDALVAAHVRQDPLRAFRRGLDAARLKVDARPLSLVLDEGGHDGGRAARLRPPGGAAPDRWHLAVDGCGPLAALPGMGCSTPITQLAALLREFGIARVIRSPAPTLPAMLVARIARAATACGLPVLPARDLASARAVGATATSRLRVSR